MVDTTEGGTPSSGGPRDSTEGKPDMQKVTAEGTSYRTLGIVSTFIVGVEAQCLGLVGDAQENPHYWNWLLEVAYAFLLVGLLLSAFGAAVSLLAARWFELLSGVEVEKLTQRWEAARPARRVGDIEKQSPANPPGGPESPDIATRPWCDRLLAKTIQYTLSAVFCGYSSFIAGMLLYAWATRPTITAAISTVVTLLGAIAVAFMHLDFDPMVTLDILHFERVRLFKKPQL